MSFLRLAARRIALPRVAFAVPQQRSRIIQCAAFSAAAGLTKEQITTRVIDVLKGFEKVKPEKLSTNSSFMEDLGLDSLDAVEVVMAVEETTYGDNAVKEFSIEIPDAEADEIRTVQQAIDYIAKTPEAR
ncbi:Acyl carrier protein, mitochondrial [Grifola frondosa]|uniref:Acyl carrier protein n=1 Tax=Grifola frondosa TaxID=5627 RepID=A0A1C7MQW1_GRIFR|nr:Acyl carrier protein, mitochondrial [Grifola frondosa]